MQQLRFDREEIVWQEVPGEVSLAFLCSGCPLRCQGCHSSGSWKAGRGAVLSEDYLRSRLQQYRGLISCVLFMGGEWHCALLCFCLGLSMWRSIGRSIALAIALAIASPIERQ